MGHDESLNDGLGSSRIFQFFLSTDRHGPWTEVDHGYIVINKRYIYVYI